MRHRNATRILHGTGVFVFLLSFALLGGCGAGSGGSLPSVPSPSGNSSGTVGNGGGDAGGGNSGGTQTVFLNLGEYATVPDQTVSLELTIDSVSLRSPSGDVSLLSAPRRIELSRFKGEPLLLGSAPRGNYNGITVSVSDPEISFIDSSGVLLEKSVASLTSATATNPSQFSIDSTPKTINLQVALKMSSDQSGSLTLTPELSFSTWGQSTKDLVRRIIEVGSSSIWVDINDPPPTLDLGFYDGGLTFATDSSTQFQGVNGLGELTAGMTVEVDGGPGPKGTLFATRLKVESEPSEVVAEGLTLGVALAQLQMLVREVHGPSTGKLPEVGKLLTVDANASTQFHLEPDDVDLSNLDFAPTFNALTIIAGQNVRAAAIAGSATTAHHLSLAKQSLAGAAGSVVTGSVPGQYSFPLNLAPDSAFAKLTGRTSLRVILQPSTQKYLYFGLEECVTCIAGGNVRVRGLLFFSGGQYHLVADWLSVG